MAEILIGHRRFRKALSALAAMTTAERENERERVGAKGARSYFAMYDGDPISLKLVLRKAYADAGLPLAVIPNSKDVYAKFEQRFMLIHRSGATEDVIRDEEREREYVGRLSRKGQQKFRSRLIAKDARCVATGCTVLRSLEAAHIVPVARQGGDVLANGLLLRADLHRLFDADLLAVSPADGRWHLHPSCIEHYGKALKKWPPLHPGRLLVFSDRWTRFSANLLSGSS